MAPQSQTERYQGLIEQLRGSPVAIHTDAANAQHLRVAGRFLPAVSRPPSQVLRAATTRLARRPLDQAAGGDARTVWRTRRAHR